MPDGIAVDVERGHIYWTNMGVPNLNDGSIERADSTGGIAQTIVPQGGTFTPKQLQLDKQSGKLYWSRPRRDARRCAEPRRVGDRDSRGDGPGRRRPPRPDEVVRRHRRRCRARTNLLDAKRPEMTRALGRILRANIELPPGQTRVESHRTSKCCSTACPSRSIWSSISRIASCTGRTAATRRAATPSTAPPWMCDRQRAHSRPRDRVHPPDGRHRHRAGLQRRPNVPHRPGRLGLFCQSRRVGKQTLLYAQGNLTGIAYAELPHTEN